MLGERIAPMLACSAPSPFDSPRHLFEVKWDGTRCLAFLQGGRVRLQNRRLLDITWRYPELSGLARQVRAREAILDGELVVLEGGRPSFPRLQEREHASDPHRAALLARELPATYIVFDLLFLDGRRCTELPLEERRGTLEGIVREGEHLVCSRGVQGQGIAFLREVIRRGLEGVMAKEKASPYLIGRRSRYWLKVKPRRSITCHVVGYTPGRGERAGLFGALLLATPEAGGWVYRGRVGSGLSQGEMVEILRALRSLELPRNPWGWRVPGARWVEPRLRCRVAFQEMTVHGRLRAPVFLELVP